ncbi:hypothetical protein OCEANICA350_11572 [Oceanicaulis sp. 350]|nr:hypothetical protein OCEANICA350_11572 [Oceanicaulis sp. 350]
MISVISTTEHPSTLKSQLYFTADFNGSNPERATFPNRNFLFQSIRKSLYSLINLFISTYIQRNYIRFSARNLQSLTF